MLDADSVGDVLFGKKIIAELLEHLRQAFVKIQFAAELFQFRIGRAIHAEGVQHDLHVSELVVVTLFPHQLGATTPETFTINSESRKDHVFLHVTRAERLIIIVNDGECVLWCGHRVVEA